MMLYKEEKLKSIKNKKPGYYWKLYFWLMVFQMEINKNLDCCNSDAIERGLYEFIQFCTANF